MVRMIKKRIHEELFHPNTPQKILTVSDSVFVVLRYAKKDKNYLISVINVTPVRQKIKIELEKNGIQATKWFDILGKTNFSAVKSKLTFDIDPFQVMWFKNKIN